MPIDVTTLNSPGWWLQKLAKKRDERLPRLARLYSYFIGDPPLPQSASTMRSAYKDFQKVARTNFAETIVTSISDRLSVRAIRTALATDLDGDANALRIWRSNSLDIELADVLETMLWAGDGYMMVGLDPDDPEEVVITGEDPRQVVTIHDPVRQSEIRAGMKVFYDPDEQKDYAFLFLRGEDILDDEGVPTGRRMNARRFVASRSRKTATGTWKFSPSSFDWDPDFGGEAGVRLNHPFVPIVRFRNRNGIGEFERHTDLLDRINHTILQRLIITLYQAFRLRAIKVDPEDAPDVDPDTGRKVDYDDLLSADPGAFIKVPKDAELWEGGQADLNGVLSAIKDDLLQLMAVTSTVMPALSDSVQQSAEGAATVKEGHEFKAERTEKRSGASLGLVFQIAFLCLGDTERAKRADIRIDWYPHTRYSLAEKSDAFSKTKDLPLETRMSDVMQMSPEAIEMAKAQVLQQQLIAPQTAAPATGVTGGSAAPATAAAPADQ